jgi:hypothetical protein
MATKKGTLLTLHTHLVLSIGLRFCFFLQDGYSFTSRVMISELTEDHINLENYLTVENDVAPTNFTLTLENVQSGKTIEIYTYVGEPSFSRKFCPEIFVIKLLIKLTPKT